jgi:hypothetical protein
MSCGVISISSFSVVGYPIAAAICLRVGTRKLCRKMIASIRIIGEKSIPPAKAGMTRLILESSGSVTSCRKRTIGL